MEKKRNALRLCELKLEPAKIREVLSISQDTFYEFTKVKRASEKKERDAKILDMHLSCFTEKEIAHALETPQQTVNNVIHGFITENSEIRKMGNEPPKSLQYTNLWQFDACDPSFGAKYPGRMPGQIVRNLLWLYTEPFDVVLDPFAGSGTTIDVCKSMSLFSFAGSMRFLQQARFSLNDSK